MKRYVFFYLTILAFLIFNSCNKPIEEYQVKNEDEKEIIELLTRYTEAINTGDSEQIITLFHENGVYVTGRGKVPLSREKMAGWKPEDWLSDGQRKFYNPEINLNGNDAKVFVEAMFGNYKTFKIFTLTKENEQWLIMKRE